MEYQELVSFLEHSGKDPSRLIFEDELTGIFNRRFLYLYFDTKVPWDALEKHPLSLIMVDVDNFKEINDTYGHQMGDLALIWIADLVKEVLGDDGMPIRYAGDEFIMLLHHKDKEASLEKGEHLLKRAQENPFHPKTLDTALSIRLSLGIATAPEDATNSKKLIQQANTALYLAKKKGGGRFVNASNVVPEEVFAKTAIYQLEEVRVVGRSRQLSQVADALRKFTKRQSQFLIAEGPAGIGKSEFLETIRRNLAHRKIWQVKVKGDPKEMFRPYYLTTKILIDILSQRKDKGAEVLKGLSPKELAYIAQIMPQLGEGVEVPEDEDESAVREGIFTTLVRLIPKIVDGRPLILLIDDLHFGDEATLILLRKLLLRGDIPLFICGASTEDKGPKGEAQHGPIERFYTTYHQEIGIQKLALTPLTAADIAKHIQGIFPNVRLPKNFEHDLLQISQGNPLFLCEILRKLVLDQKITLIGQQWDIQPLEEDYLPKSLEEIVTQKIAALDEDSRQMLDQLSALGEESSLSVLIGSSAAMEAKVLDFIDQAVAQGLLSSDFELNDEVIHFLGKRVLEITYGAMEQDRKQELHKRIGDYQETLYQRRLLPSAATLAYHFKRSTDHEKARTYEKILTTSSNKCFSAQEASEYIDDKPAVAPAADVPLNPEDLPLVPKLLRDFMVAVRNINLYPPGSKSIISVNRQLKASIDRILEKNEYLNIVQVERATVINGQKIDITEFRFVAEGFIQFLNRFQLKGIAFYRGLTDQELATLIEAFGRTKQKVFDKRYWERISVENQLEHIDLKQMRYTMTEKLEGPFIDPETGAAAPKETPPRPAGPLEQQDLKQLPEILRSLVSGAKSIQLYPLKSKAVSNALKGLKKNLRAFLKRRQVLTLSRASDALLVNGQNLDTKDFKPLADSFLELLDSIGLGSLTFLERFTEQELETFIGALGDLPPGVVEGTFWKRLARERDLSGILFDQHLYEVRVAQTTGLWGVDQTLTESAVGILEAQPEEFIPPESFPTFLDELPDRLREMFLNNQEKKIKQTVAKLFSGFERREPEIRKMAIDVCGSLLESLTPAFQYDFVKVLSDPLLSAFSEETDSHMIVEMAHLLSSLVNDLIEFVDYPTAARILSHLNRRQQTLEEVRDSHAQMLAKSLQIRLEPKTQKLLVEDLGCGEPSRQRNAAQLLDSLGQAATPLLLDVIKQEEDYRPRRIAAILLEKLGPLPTKRLKRLLALEISPQERSRILDVIDALSSDLKIELVHALGDEDLQVRQAAFRLAERLNDSQTVELLLDLAKGRTGNLAVAAIECLSRLNPANIDEELMGLLHSTKDEEVRIACCRALGQIAKPACIEPLSKILVRKGFFPFRKGSSAQARAAAAFALGQISHPRVAEVLAPFLHDKDPRIQQVARSVLETAQSSPQEKGLA